MDVFVVLEVHEACFMIEGGDGAKRTVSLAGIDWPVQADMPVLLAKDGSVRPYSGAFFDEEDGGYKKLVFEDGRFTLAERQMPLSSDDLQAFLSELIRTNDPSLNETLDMAIEDLLARGQTELAFALMNRQEALAPSESMRMMQARYAEEKHARASELPNEIREIGNG